MNLIEFQDYPSTETPLNAENLNYNFNELNKNNTYSLEEQVVGKWLGKPLYRKTIAVGSLPNASTLHVQIGVSNIDKIMFDLSHSFWSNGTSYYPFTLASASDGYSKYSVLLACNNKANGEIEIISGTDRTGYSAYVTILYTKTTE